MPSHPFVTTVSRFVPVVGRLVAQRDKLISERDALRQALGVSSPECDSLTEALTAFTEGQKRRRLAAYTYSSRQYWQRLREETDKCTDHSTTSTVERHKDTWVLFEELGTKRPYRKTYRFAGDYLNERHKSYTTCPTGLNGVPACINIGINGYLQVADALKLYELAYHSPGNILEIGTFNGLSTSIMAQALADAHSKATIITDDIDSNSSAIARRNLFNRPGQERVQFHVEDASRFMEQLCAQGRKFAFIFIDHWHGYETTFDAAEHAKHLLEPGGFLLFHDYNDPSNSDPSHVYGVYQAVADSLLIDDDYVFFGCFGCCALFRKKG
jgi:cephalosporin hydroxylase